MSFTISNPMEASIGNALSIKELSASVDMQCEAKCTCKGKGCKAGCKCGGCKACGMDASVEAKKFSTTKRQKMAKEGTAKPDGSYPIASPKDVSNAVKDFHRSNGSPSDKAHIQKRAKALGMSNPFSAE